MLNYFSYYNKANRYKYSMYLDMNIITLFTITSYMETFHVAHQSTTCQAIWRRHQKNLQHHGKCMHHGPSQYKRLIALASWYGTCIVIRYLSQSHCVHLHIIPILPPSWKVWLDHIQVYNIKLPTWHPSMASPAQHRMEVKFPQNGDTFERSHKTHPRLT